MVPTLISVLIVVGVGHPHAVQVAETQPAKLAAFEGLWETKTNAPLLLFGVPNPTEERTDFTIAIPRMLTIMIDGSADTESSGAERLRHGRPPLLFL